MALCSLLHKAVLLSTCLTLFLQSIPASMSAFYFGFSAATISGVQAVMLITAGLLSAALAFITNWLALIPWRRAKGQHWSERARLYFPVRVAAAFSVLIFLNPWRLNPR